MPFFTPESRSGESTKLGALHNTVLFCSLHEERGAGWEFYDKLGAKVGNRNPINGALATFIDQLG